MDPVAHGDVAGVVTGPCGAGLDAQVNVYALPLDQFTTAVQAEVSSGSAYTAHLPYGDYRLEAVASGFQAFSQTVTIGVVPATLDFALGAIETVELFASDFGERGVPVAVSAWPNPFNPQTTVSFTVPGDGQAAVQVFDLRGRLVGTLVSGFLTAGTERCVWDGTDEAGNPAGCGEYSVRLKSREDQAVTKIFMVK